MERNHRSAHSQNSPTGVESNPVRVYARDISKARKPLSASGGSNWRHLRTIRYTSIPFTRPASASTAQSVLYKTYRTYSDLGRVWL